jgi:hypothetical protein
LVKFTNSENILLKKEHTHEKEREVWNAYKIRVVYIGDDSRSNGVPPHQQYRPPLFREELFWAAGGWTYT